MSKRHILSYYRFRQMRPSFHSCVGQVDDGETGQRRMVLACTASPWYYSGAGRAPPALRWHGKDQSGPEVLRADTTLSTEQIRGRRWSSWNKAKHRSQLCPVRRLFLGQPPVPFPSTAPNANLPFQPRGRGGISGRQRLPNCSVVEVTKFAKGQARKFAGPPRSLGHTPPCQEESVMPRCLEVQRSRAGAAGAGYPEGGGCCLRQRRGTFSRPNPGRKGVAMDSW